MVVRSWPALASCEYFDLPFMIPLSFCYTATPIITCVSALWHEAEVPKTNSPMPTLKRQSTSLVRPHLCLYPSPVLPYYPAHDYGTRVQIKSCFGEGNSHALQNCHAGDVADRFTALGAASGLCDCCWAGLDADQWRESVLKELQTSNPISELVLCAAECTESPSASTVSLVR
jgi:hypothetical protein